MSFKNSDLALAFPRSVRDHALRLSSTLPSPAWHSETFSVSVGGEKLHIPVRIYHDSESLNPTGLPSLQEELLSCLSTRHASGYVRERSLRRIVGSDQAWTPPFVVQLVGEYVVEILDVIQANLHILNLPLYRRFLAENPTFLALTKQRVFSYWDCYYRRLPKEHYAGFQIIEFFETVVNARDSAQTERQP